MIRTENLVKAYSGVKAVDSINMAVGKGEICGFLGPNGAGKTTTIGMLVGLIEPTSGKCFIKDIEVSRNPLAIKRMIGYLPEGVGFYANLNARQNLKYLSKFYDIKDADARIGELLSYVGLEKVDKPAGAFSRGMKQRLGLARALLNDPDVIFLDEPTNGLDPEGVISFRKIITEQAEKGKTIFFSSHILDEVEHICNTICIISGGKILAQGTLDEVRQKLHKGDHMKIVVKVVGTMPKLSNPGIIDATYHDGTATLNVQSDILNEIAGELIKNNVRIRELMIEEESLEDIFLETVYRRE